MTEDKPVSKPVDTIAVPREVLRGVREACDAAYSAMNDYLNGKHFDLKAMRTATYFSDPIDKCEKTLASLDAVLSEGK